MMINLCTIQLDKNNRELTQQGTPSFPVASYLDYLEIIPVPYHWHEEVEIILVDSGVLELCVDMETMVLHAGEGIFINSGRLHSCVSYDYSNCILKSFVFHPKLVYGTVDSVFYSDYIAMLISENAPSYCMLKAQSCELISSSYTLFQEKNHAYEFKIRTNFSEIILSCTNEMNSNVKKTNLKKQRLLKRSKLMMSYIHQHYAQNITLQDIAHSANIKENECLRCFKSVLRRSPIQYLKQYRLEQAAFLLKSTTSLIIDVAMECGFSDMSYFSKSFKEHFQVTPKQYREQTKTN